MQSTILVTHDVLHAHWQLRQPPSEWSTMVGWRTTAEPEADPGPNDEVALILARALTDIALVTFPLAEPPQQTAGDQVRDLTARGEERERRDGFVQDPTALHLLSTRSATSMVQMFGDGGVSWPLQSTLALLSIRDAGMPKLSRNELLGLLDAQAVDFAACDASVLGAFIPGVDGAMALLACRDRAFHSSALAALEASARAAGYTFLACDARTFHESLAGDGSRFES